MQSVSNIVSQLNSICLYPNIQRESKIKKNIVIQKSNTYRKFKTLRNVILQNLDILYKMFNATADCNIIDIEILQFTKCLLSL